MISKSAEQKILKKQRRCQHLITSETQIPCVNYPTTYLVVCNAGLSTGLQKEVLVEYITKYGIATEVVMLPGKSYCFIKCADASNAESIFVGMHGKSRLAQHDNVLYLSYCLDVPKVDDQWNQSLPPGLMILDNFVEVDDEVKLLDCINWDAPSDDKVNSSTLKHRLVKHYGYEFLYGSNNVDREAPLDQKIPQECNSLWPKLRQTLPNLIFSEPDQLTVNKYQPGQGIPPHVDTHSAFLNPIFSLSLGSDVVMEFRNPDGCHVNVLVPRRSLLIMSDESRYGWTHGITPRTMDIIQKAGSGLTLVKRDLRVSFTFRSLKCSPCQCDFKLLCDTFKNNQETQLKTESPSKLEYENVHKVYDEIANHFSETRHSPWPEVEKFCNSFTLGEILVDIGCGNGKYLPINDQIFKIGCDRSRGLLNVCHERRLNIFQCDCLNVPIKSNSIDGCISIAVIHHLASKERRIQALNEMGRILVIGGRGLVYVWAKNQELQNKKSSYLRQNKRNNKPNAQLSNEHLDNHTYQSGLPVHINRTQFAHQDMLVPWKLKSDTNDRKETFLRYYHVFEENELESLCADVNNVKVIKSYYDQANPHNNLSPRPLGTCNTVGTLSSSTVCRTRQCSNNRRTRPEHARAVTILVL